MELVGAKEVAARLGLHVKTVRRMMSEGTIPAVKVGRRWFATSNFANGLASGESPAAVDAPSEPPPGVSDLWQVRYAYDQLRLRMPSVDYEGLYKVGRRYVVHCPSAASEKGEDGRPLAEWFDRACRPVCCPVSISATLPAGAAPVEPRSISELGRLRGDPHTGDQALMLMRRRSPRLPILGLSRDPSHNLLQMVLKVGREPTGTEAKEAAAAYESLGIGFPLQIEVVQPGSAPAKQPTPRPRNHQTNLTVRPPSGTAARSLWESDEDFWSIAEGMLWTPEQGQVDALPIGFSSAKGPCLVHASSFPTGNIRTYLALHDRVFLTLPYTGEENSFLESLRVDLDTLLQLAELDRVAFVVPQSPERYSGSVFEGIAQAVPEKVLLTRRLATASVVDARRRSPFEYPIFDVSARQAVLRSFAVARTIARDRTQVALLDCYAEALQSSWTQIEHRLQHEGAAAGMLSPTAFFVGEFFRRVHGRDLRLEAHGTMSMVQQAGALNAVLYPPKAGGYDAGPLASLMASVYTGMRVSPTPTPTVPLGESETVLERLGLVAEDCDPIELVRSIKPSDSNRLREVVDNIALGCATPEDLARAIRAFNEKVEAFSRRNQGVGWVDIAAVAGLITAPEAITPLAAYLLTRLATTTSLPRFRITEPIVERLAVATTLSPRDVVFVARLRG